MFDYRHMFPELASVRKARETRVALEEAAAQSKRMLKHYSNAIINREQDHVIQRLSTDASAAHRRVMALDAELLGARVVAFD